MANHPFPFTWLNVLVTPTMVGRDVAERVAFHVFVDDMEAEKALSAESFHPILPLPMPSGNEFLEMSHGFAGPFPFIADYRPPGPVTPLSALETLLKETTGRFVPVRTQDLSWPGTNGSYAINGCLPPSLASRRLDSFGLQLPPAFDFDTVADLMTVREEVALRWLGPERLRLLRKAAFAAPPATRTEGTKGMPLSRLPLSPTILEALGHLGATTVHGALAVDRSRLSRLLSAPDLRAFDRVLAQATVRRLALPSSPAHESILDFPVSSWTAELPIARLDVPAATKEILDGLSFARVRDLRNFPVRPLLDRGLQRDALDGLRQAISRLDASPRTRIVSVQVFADPPAQTPVPAPKPEGPMVLQGMEELEEGTLDTLISHLRIPQRILHICDGLAAKRVRDLASMPAKRMKARGLTTMGLSTLRRAIEDVQGDKSKARIKTVKRKYVDRRFAILDRGLVPDSLARSPIGDLQLDARLSAALGRIAVHVVGDLCTVPWADFATEVDRPMSQIKLIRQRLLEMVAPPSTEPGLDRPASPRTSPTHALPSLHDAMHGTALHRLDVPSNVIMLLARAGFETVGALVEAAPGKPAQIVTDGFPDLCRGLSSFQKANAPYLEGYDPFQPETPTMGRFGPIPTLADLIETALQDLDERSERILRMRLCLEGSWTLEAAAGELGVTKERIRQIETKAVKKIRDRWMWPALLSAHVTTACASGQFEIGDFAGRGWAVGLSEEAVAASIRLLGPDDLKARKVKGALSLRPEEDLPGGTRREIESRFVNCDPRLSRSEARTEMLRAIDLQGAADFADRLLESWDVTPALIGAKYGLGGHNAAVDVILARSHAAIGRKDVEIALLAAGVKANGNVNAALTLCGVRLGNGKLVSARSLPDPETIGRIVDCVIQVVQDIGPSTSETILKRLLSARNPLVRNMDVGILNGAIRADGRLFKAGSKAWSVEEGSPNLGQRLTAAACAYLAGRGRPSRTEDIKRHLRKGHPDVAALQMRDDGDLMLMGEKVWALRSWPEEIRNLPVDATAKESGPRKPRLHSTTAVHGPSVVGRLSEAKRLLVIAKAMMACLEEAPPEGITSSEAFHKLAEAGYEPKMSTLISFFNRNGVKDGDSRPYRWKAKPSDRSARTKPGKPSRSKPRSRR